MNKFLDKAKKIFTQTKFIIIFAKIVIP